MGIPESGTFILEDGDVLELTPEVGEVVDQVPAGHVFIDGRSTIDERSPILRDRRALSREGMLVVVVALDKATGMPVRAPEILSRGFKEADDMSEVFPRLSVSVMESLDHTPHFPINWDYTNELVKDTVTRFLLKETGKCPVILPVALEL
jgi:ribonuclease J